MSIISEAEPGKHQLAISYQCFGEAFQRSTLDKIINVQGSCVRWMHSKVNSETNFNKNKNIQRVTFLPETISPPECTKMWELVHPQHKIALSGQASGKMKMSSFSLGPCWTYQPSDEEPWGLCKSLISKISPRRSSFLGDPLLRSPVSRIKE